MNGHTGLLRCDECDPKLNDSAMTIIKTMTKLVIRFSVALISLAGVARTQEAASDDPNWQPGKSPNFTYTIDAGEFKGQLGRRFFGLQVEPTVINLGTNSPDVRRTAKVQIDVMTTTAINVTKVECTSKQYEVELRRLASGTNYVIEVSARPPLQFGPIHEQLLVRTDKEDVPVLPIYMLGMVVGALDVNPWELFVPPSQTAGGTYCIVRIRSRNGKPFSVTKVVPPADSVHVDSIVQTGDNQYLVRLIMQPDATLDSKYLRILTDVPRMPEIPIRFRRQQ
jgi:hypothetical protein